MNKMIENFINFPSMKLKENEPKIDDDENPQSYSKIF